MMRAWSSCALPAGRMPGVTSLKSGRQRRAQRRRFDRRADDAVEPARRGEPGEPQRLLRRAVVRRPCRCRSASARLVSTVTAISSGGGRALRCGRLGDRVARGFEHRAPAAAWTLSIHTPSRVAAAQACATVFGNVVELEIEKDAKAALDHPAHGLRAGDDEHLLADLERAGRGIEPVGQRERVHRVRRNRARR